MCLLQFTFFLVDRLVDSLTLCVKLGVVDGGARLLVGRLIRCFTFLLHNCVVSETLRRLGLEPSLISSLGLAFLLVDGVECSGTSILVDRLVHSFALVVVDRLVLGSAHLTNKLRQGCRYTLLPSVVRKNGVNTSFIYLQSAFILSYIYSVCSLV